MKIQVHLKKNPRNIASPPILTSFIFLTFLAFRESKIPRFIPIFFAIGTRMKVKINEIVNIINKEVISLNILISKILI